MQWLNGMQKKKPVPPHGQGVWGECGIGPALRGGRGQVSGPLASAVCWLLGVSCSKASQLMPLVVS